MSLILPPSALQARLTEGIFDSRFRVGLPPLAPCDTSIASARGRRSFLKAATAGLLAFGANSSRAASNQLVFSPDVESAADPSPPSSLVTPQAAVEQLRLGEIPADFWLRPRELRLQRQGTREFVNIVYWKDGAIQPAGYWQACALLRDVRANVMTTMDPAVLDILRGVIGYYEAWKWPYALVVNSGFRTVATNNSLAKEGAAKNSMHLYGKAADIYMPGIPSRDIALLGLHLRQGGVGFYPDKGFTHLDTGRLRVWRG